jgi:uncharacterized protein YoxC
VSIETLLAIFVAVTAIAVGLQSVFMTIAARSILKLIQKLEQRVDRFELDTQELIDRARTVVGCAEPIGRIAEDVSTTVNVVSEMITTRASDIDQFVEETIQFGREQASKLDHVVTDTVEKFEQATEVIQKDVAQPVTEISSIVQGIRAGITYLFNRKANATSRGKNHSDEEELFI